MSAAARTLLGRSATLVARERVFEMPDGLEVESAEQYELTRKRVLFEDVVLITYHREAGLGFISVHALVVLFFFGMGAIIFAANGSLIAAAILAAFGIPSLLMILLRAALKVDVVTVFGRRSKAVIRFPYRKRRAREAYGHLCARTRQIQEQIAAESRGPEAPPEEELPPAPPDFASS